MARETLSKALELMFGHEGGYSNVATDSGGPTKYGITHKTLAAHRGQLIERHRVGVAGENPALDHLIGHAGDDSW